VRLSPRHEADETSENGFPANATFLVHANATDREDPDMMDRDEDIAKLRLLAGKLSADWRSRDFMAPALARRIRDFAFAQDKRRRTYGEERPWGILGLYDHLAAIRVDVAWAEDAAWRRANGEPYMSWSDFDSGTKQGINRPFFTYFLLFVCTILLATSIALNGWKIEALDVNPMIGPSAETLIRMGAKSSDLIVNYGEGWRLISSIFLHAGLVHYVINMLALWFVGSAIERTHGIFSAVLFFVIPAIGGTILSSIFLPDYITVGASGGIFGLIGACLSDIAMNWKLLFSDFVNENDKKHKHAMVVVVLLFDILLNSIIGLTPYVDNFTRKLGAQTTWFDSMNILLNLSTLQIWVEWRLDSCVVCRRWSGYQVISSESRGLAL
jgi:membrane associated rhomboid family serine protease